ncbi:GntR family transcriptional regulator [Pelagibacterium sp. 26DY04]|uniref:GntR family transcriptional regulator n=1 Tax=Pelagibacterium sp. 26DY04 TaxID=2967130 RepID=UPI00281685FA|nr:GntR family transcriptional regulator [Pelagibacterium sp. 26DY04]WMT87740.1 GntR family transcriptional regulator [Pelagibacterium sp. 26DY04]
MAGTRPLSDSMDEINDTVGEQAFRRIRGDIISGTLKPGQKLKLERLKSQYGVSVSTLREILNRLTTEDLVLAEGQRGFEVAPASVDNLREVGDLRLVLENHALALSFAAGDLDWEAEVVAAHHKLSSIEKALLGGDADRTEQWIKYDFAFHHAMISACGSKSLLAIHQSIFDRFMRYHMLAQSFRGGGVAEDHGELFRLALARDVEGAQAKLASHIHLGIDHILSTGKL